MHNSVKTSLLEKNQVISLTAENSSLLSVAFQTRVLKVTLTLGFWELLDDCAMFRKIVGLHLFKECSVFLERDSNPLKPPYS